MMPAVEGGVVAQPFWDCANAANSLQQFACELDSLASTALDIAILLAAIGTIGMALVEVVKAAIGWRGYFHATRINAFIRRRAVVLDSETVRRLDPSRAWRQVMDLVAGDEAGPALRAWLSQPTDRLFVRLRAAAEVAIDWPRDYEQVFRLLVGDLDAAEEWYALTDDERIQPRPRRPDDADGSGPEQLRVRLSRAATHRLEALEMHVQWWWAFFNQVSGIAASVIVFMIVAPMTETFKGKDCLELAALAMLAGMLSPFAKDLKDNLGNLGLRARWGPR